ncbi:MAG: hypothetical protein FWF08_10230 [Oscillospiraceae bacterium]|nr:hypothetical protein [Oscillospiraceae bacterium]
MKKFFAITLALVLALSLAACGNSGKNNGDTGITSPAGAENTTAKTGNNDSATANSPSGTGKAFSYFNGGTFHMKAKSEVQGIQMEMEYYAKGSNMAVISEAGGEKTRMITRDGKIYVVMDESKSYIDYSENSMFSQSSSSKDISAEGKAMTGSGTAQFNGKNLSYEEYEINDSSKQQYFFDGNDLAGIRTLTNEDTVDIIIVSIDKDVPDSIFEVPEGYEKMQIGF